MTVYTAVAGVLAAERKARHLMAKLGDIPAFLVVALIAATIPEFGRQFVAVMILVAGQTFLCRQLRPVIFHALPAVGSMAFVTGQAPVLTD